MGLCVHRNHEGLLETGKLGGREVCISNTYSHATLSPPERFCIKVGSCVSHFSVSIIVWAKSQDGVHKSQCLKRKESRSGSNRGPSAFLPGALPLGHTGSRSPTSPTSPFLQKIGNATVYSFKGTDEIKTK